jgi:hypothetical protein
VLLPYPKQNSFICAEDTQSAASVIPMQANPLQPTAQHARSRQALASSKACKHQFCAQMVTSKQVSVYVWSCQYQPPLMIRLACVKAVIGNSSNLPHLDASATLKANRYGRTEQINQGSIIICIPILRICSHACHSRAACSSLHHLWQAAGRNVWKQAPPPPHRRRAS